MAIFRFWQDMLHRGGLKRTDKIMVGNATSNDADYIDVSEILTPLTTDDLAENTTADKLYFKQAERDALTQMPTNYVAYTDQEVASEALSRSNDDTELQRQLNIALVGDEAFAHANRVSIDGGTTIDLQEVRNYIKLHRLAKLAMIANSRKVAKLYAQIGGAAGDFTFAGSAVDEINSAGVSTTVLDNMARFDHQGEYVEATDTSYYDADASTGKVTIPMQSFVSGSDKWYVIIKSSLNTTTDGYLIGRVGSTLNNIGINSSGKLFYRENNGTVNLFNKTFVSIQNVEVELAFISNGTIISLYVNGIFDSSVTPVTVYLQVGKFLKGYSDDTNGCFGLIKKALIGNRELLASEVLDRYNGVAIDPKFIGANNVNLFSGADSNFSTPVTLEGTPFTNFNAAYTATPYGTPVSVEVVANVCNIVSNATVNNSGLKWLESIGNVGKQILYSVNVSAITGTWELKLFDNATSSWLVKKTFSTTGIKSVEFLSPPTGTFSVFLVSTTVGATISIDASTNDNIFKAIGNTLLLDGGKTASNWYDKTHADTGAITGATLVNSNGFSNNIHPLTTCPKLRLEPSATNLFQDSENPATQTITTVIGTTYTISCNGAGLLKVDETGGNGRGGVVTEVDSFTYVATATSMVVTVVTVPTNVNFTATSVPLRHIPTPVGSTASKVKDQITQKTLSFATNNFEVFIEQEIFNPSESLNTFRMSDSTDFVAIYNDILDVNGANYTLPNGKNKIIVQNNASNLVAYVNGSLVITTTRKTTTLNLYDLTFDNPAVQEYSQITYQDSSNLSTVAEMITATS